jgi:hypothetical protein
MILAIIFLHFPAGTGEISADKLSLLQLRAPSRPDAASADALLQLAAVQYSGQGAHVLDCKVAVSHIDYTRALAASDAAIEAAQARERGNCLLQLVEHMMLVVDVWYE